MKSLSLLTLILFSLSGYSQKPEISGSWEDSLYGLEMMDGGEILPRIHSNVNEIFRIKDSITGYYIARQGHQDRLHFWDGQALKELSEDRFFSSITYTYVSSRQKELFIGITETAEYLYYTGSGWNVLNHTGYTPMGGSNAEGKWAICQDGKAITDYKYDAVFVDQGVPFQVKTNEGWEYLDHDLQPMKNPFDFECYEHIDGGVLCSDYTYWRLPDGPILKLGDRMDFYLDGPSYADVGKGFAIEQNGKYGVVNGEGEILVPFIYQELYVSETHYLLADYFDKAYMIVVNNGDGYRFYSHQAELNLFNRQHFMGFHSQWILVEQNDTLYYEDFNNDIRKVYGQNSVKDLTTGLYGYVELGGYISWEISHEYVEYHGNRENRIYYVKDQGQGALYDSNKQKLIDVPFDKFYSMYSEHGIYYAVKADENEGKYALVNLDLEHKKWVVLTDYVFRGISSSYSPDGAFFATHQDGYAAIIQPDGSFKKKVD